jgi:soluble lytic murein transglycosylase-like protein
VMAAYRYGRKYDLEPELLLAIAYVESSFRPNVINHGCYGLMQVSLATWKSKLQLNADGLLEINYNMDKGAWILKHYIIKSGDVWRGVFMYTNGYRGRNMKYVPKVRKFYRGIGGMNE